MKRILAACTCLIVLFISCKKSSGGGSSNGNFNQFLAKSQWVGVMSQNGYQYAPPATIRFKSENSFVVYAPFYLFESSVLVTRDSLNGSVKKIEEMSDGTTVTVTADLDHFGEVVFTVKDRKKIAVNAADPTNANRPLLFELDVYESSFSLDGTEWSGPVMTGGGPTAGMLAYPDLSTVGFGNGTTYYRRNGNLVPAQPTPQLPTPGELRVGYKQVGAAVFMSGYNESGGLLIGYFGVLQPGNTKMMVFSGSINSRLPYYTQTIAWYGPIGQTPVIEKK